MACLLVCILGMLCQSQVAGQSVETIKISENYDGLSFKEILLRLEEDYQVPFYYKNQWIQDTILKVSFNDEMLPAVIGKLLENTALSFAIFNDNAIIIAPESMLSREFSMQYFIDRNRQQAFTKEENWPANLEIINLGNNEIQLMNDEYTISGVVTDQLEGDTLAGATILIKDLDLATTTEDDGQFQLRLAGGLHLFEIRMVGYETKLLGVNVLSSTDWQLGLLPEATELNEVMVNATADDSNIKSSIIGLTKMSSIELKEMPVFLGEPDVIKSILTLPGVSTVGEGASGFNVRGGNIDQNLIMQDNALIFNSSHAMGFFSVFNPDAVREVTLYKGHIPAQYGGRISSVLNVGLKGNNYDEFKADGGLGALASRLTIETPLVKEKTALLLGGRVAYSDWVLNFVNNPDVRNSSLTFYDINAKISQRLGKNGTLALSFYRSHDKFNYSDEFGFSWNLNTLSLSWNQAFKPELISELSLSYSGSGNTSFQPSGIDGYILGNGMDNLKLKEDFLITSLENHTINTGIELNGYIPEDEMLNPFNDNSTIIPYAGIRDKGIESAIYINDVLDLSPILSLSLGLRYSMFSQFGPAKVHLYENGIPAGNESITDSLTFGSGEKVVSYNGFDPRVSLRYTLNPNSSIKMSYNRINQYVHLISNTTAALPIDYWQVSNTYFKPLRAHNFSLGYFRNFRLNQWETSAEIYYRDLENIIDYRDFADLFLNDHLETELLSGDGRSFGLELFIKKKTGKLNGWLSYTFSRTFIRIKDEQSDENINRGAWYPSKFDQPHNLNIVGNYDINKTNQLSFNFTFASGRPLTGPDSNYGLDNYVVPNYSDRNKFRIPNYHRLDVSYTLHRGLLRTHRYKDSFTLSIYNLYARQNAYSIYFKRDERNTFGAYKLSILGAMLPSLTYNFQF